MATNKQGWEPERQKTSASASSALSLSLDSAEHLGSGCQPCTKQRFGCHGALADVGVGWKDVEGKMSFMLSAVAVVSLGDRQLLLPLQTHFPKTVSRMILSDCFSIWAIKNTRAGIHLQSVFSFFSSGNGNELVLPRHAHMHSAFLFWHSKTNHNTELAKGRPWSASCWKEGSALSLPAVWWAVCLTAPSRGKKSQILLRN